MIETCHPCVGIDRDPNELRGLRSANVSIVANALSVFLRTTLCDADFLMSQDSGVDNGRRGAV